MGCKFHFEKSLTDAMHTICGSDEVLRDKFSDLAHHAINTPSQERCQLYFNKILEIFGNSAKDWINWWRREAVLKLIAKSYTTNTFIKNAILDEPRTNNASESLNAQSKQYPFNSIGRFQYMLKLDRTSYFDIKNVSKGIELEYKDNTTPKRNENNKKRQAKRKSAKKSKENIAAGHLLNNTSDYDEGTMRDAVKNLPGKIIGPTNLNVSDIESPSEKTSNCETIQNTENNPIARILEDSFNSPQVEKQPSIILNKKRKNFDSSNEDDDDDDTFENDQNKKISKFRKFHNEIAELQTSSKKRVRKKAKTWYPGEEYM